MSNRTIGQCPQQKWTFFDYSFNSVIRGGRATRSFEPEGKYSYRRIEAKGNENDKIVNGIQWLFLISVPEADGSV